MPWFEKPFLAVLRREYAASMRFTGGGEHKPPLAPPGPCQLYVHVPFCEVLCPFCSFHRVRFRPERTSRYFQALREEIRQYHAAGFRFKDLYVGGGTPTVDMRELQQTIDLVRSLSPVKTVSVETNPDHLDARRLAVLRDCGVTRLSVGVQSFDDGLLRGMERLEKYGSAAAIRERLAAAKGVFPTLNVDMIFNLPQQTIAMLDRDLDDLLELEVDQVSFYPLMTARTARRRIEKSMGRNDASQRHEFYERILDRLLPTYRAASAWCFSRGEGMFDEYIIEQQDYVGVGSGAFSLVNGAMYSTSFSLHNYCRLVESGHTGVSERRSLGTKERMRYDYLVRLFGGELRRDYIEQKYGRAFWLRMAPELAAMRLIGATRHDGDAIRLTRRGMYCWMLMMAEFFNAVNGFREQMRGHIRAELDAWNEPAAASTKIDASNIQRVSR
jgi:coproporphyrinogen III oxidase-like Fe-S oxidoreductase